ncbi:phage tail sheath family protein [Flavisolibacter sp. BT320]|nr:phage tail sheath family protein [Flavisolibacter longurius]
MATTYRTPGVYVEEVPKLPPSVAAGETAIPAFIGYTEKALDRNGIDLTNKPTRITSLLEYERFFGRAQEEDELEITFEEEQDASGNTVRETISVAFNAAASRHLVYYALQAYFANGGGPCYVVSVGPYKPLGDALVFDELDTGLQSLAKEDEPTLIVFPEGQKMVQAEYYTLQNNALAQCNALQDRFCIMDVFDTGETLETSGDVDAAVLAFRNGITSPFIRYGAAYFPNLRTTLRYRYDEGQVAVVHQVNGAAGGLNGMALSGIKSGNTAAYSKLKLALDQFGVVLPPSSSVAGIYATVDASRGVWKAPANVGLNAVSDLTFKVTNDIQDKLNVDPGSGKSINVIRPFTGRGILVWGARTLAGNDNEWRYVPVRRLFNMVEEACKKATGQFVFEPNEANTWAKVRAMISNFLTVLWRQGALAGAKPEHAFYVACGLGTTMSPEDILEGKLIVEIGMAAVRPAEFIILRFSHMMQQS